MITDRFSNRVDLLIGLRGMDPAAMERARAAIEIDPSGLYRDLVRRVAAGFSREAARHVELLLREAE